MFRKASLALLLVLPTVVATGARVAGETSEQLLNRLEARSHAPATLHVNATTTRDAFAPIEAVEIRTEFWQQRKEGTCRSRLEFEKTTVSKEGRRKVREYRLEVDQGNFRWIEKTSRGQTRILKDVAACANPFYAEIREQLAKEETTIAPVEEIDGTRCAVLRFKRGLEKFPIVTTYWIAEETGVVLRKTVSSVAGNTEMHLVELDTNEPIDETLFRYSPPDGAQVNDVAAIDAMLDGMQRIRRTFDSIYLETSARRVDDPRWGEKRTREWLVQDGRKLMFRREARAIAAEGQTGASNRVLTISDGVHHWREEVRGVDIQATKTAATGGDPELDPLRGRTRAQDARLLGPREIEGERCSGLELQANDMTDRYWFSERYGILWKSEHIRTGRQSYTTVRTVTRVQSDRPFDPGLFSYSAPEGVVVHDSAVEDAKMKSLLDSTEEIDTGTWRSGMVKRLEATSSILSQWHFSFTISPDDRWLVFYKTRESIGTPATLVALDLASGINHEFDVEMAGIHAFDLNDYCWSADGRYCFGGARKPGQRSVPQYPSFILDLGGDSPGLVNQYAGRRADGKEPKRFADFGYRGLSCSDCYDLGKQVLRDRLPKDYRYLANSSATGAALARDGSKIYCQKRLGMAVGLYEYDLISGTDRRIARVAPEFRGGEPISEIRESPNEKFIAFHIAQQLHVVDLERGRTYRVADGVYHRTHWDSSSKRLFFYSCERPGGCGGAGDYLYWVVVEDLRKQEPGLGGSVGVSAQPNVSPR